MNHKQKNLLIELRDHLLHLPEDAPAFDMKVWKCNTTACAVGHAADLKGWKAAGFELQGTLGPQDDRYTPYFKGSQGFTAVANLLGITPFESMALFDPDFYTGESDEIDRYDVADRIDEFLDHKEIST